MAVTYQTNAKDNRMTAVRDLLNGGTLQIGTSGMATVLATFTFDATSGTVASGVLTFSSFPKTVSAAATGTAAAARLRTSGGVDVVTGLTVGTSGTDIVLDSTSVTSGQSVTINAGPKITHAA